MSRPSSASTSLLPSRSHTPVPPTAAVSSSQYRAHTTTLSHKLRHLFDTPKHATLAVSIVLHELSNIPQLEGQFIVQWKFRGRRPKHDAVLHPNERTSAPSGIASNNGIHSKPSLPNLKLQQASTSSISLRQGDLGGSTSSAASSLAPPPRPRTRLPPNHANSFRQASAPFPVSSSSSSLTARGSRTSLARADKKGSDPTPLRNSVEPDSGGSTPIVMEEPEEVDGGLGAVENTPTGGGASSGSSSGRTSTDSMRRRQASTLTELPRTPSSLSSPSRLALSNNRTASLRVSGTGALPPARSGTMPSPDVLTGRVPGTDDYDLTRPRSISRSSSLSRDRASESSVSASQSRPRSMTASSVATSLTRVKSSTPHSSVHRKGATAPKSLSAHTVSIEYEIQHTIKVPLGKAVPVSGTSTPSSGRPREPTSKQHGQAPILGAGPLSESGIRLTVLQVQQDRGKANLAKHNLESGQQNGDDASSHADQGRKQEDKTTVYGWVDVDLAPFAGLGPTTRKYLLKECKTNATVRLTAHVRPIGGDDHWVAPPLHDGHHATGIRDLTGTEAADNVINDLQQLHRAPSRASASEVSSISDALSSSHSGLLRPSASSSSLSRNRSEVSLIAVHPPKLDYKSYEHHLKPDVDKERTRGNDASSLLSIPSGTRARSSSPASRDAPESPRLASPSGSTRRMSHRHHTHHMRDSVHFQHGAHRREAETDAHELPPEFVIEAIFNPQPADAETPFTYMPEGSGSPLFANEQIFGFGNGSAPAVATVNEPPSPHEGQDPFPAPRKGWGKLRKRVASGQKEK